MAERCPKCGADVCRLPNKKGYFSAIAECQCAPDCPIRQCVCCGFNGHRMLFDPKTKEEAMAKVKLYTPDPQDAEPDSHPTQSTHGTGSIDFYLRGCKPEFELERRAGNNEPIWRRRRDDGTYGHYTQTQAVAIADAECEGARKAG